MQSACWYFLPPSPQGPRSMDEQPDRPQRQRTKMYAAISGGAGAVLGAVASVSYVFGLNAIKVILVTLAVTVAGTLIAYFYTNT